MKRFGGNVGAFEHSLDERPEILGGVGVNVALHVGDGVIDHLMIEFGIRSAPVTALLVGAQSIGVEDGVLGVDVFTDERHDVFPAGARHHAGGGLTRLTVNTALDRADDGSEVSFASN